MKPFLRSTEPGLALWNVGMSLHVRAMLHWDEPEYAECLDSLYHAALEFSELVERNQTPDVQTLQTVQPMETVQCDCATCLYHLYWQCALEIHQTVLEYINSQWHNAQVCNDPYAECLVWLYGAALDLADMYA